MGQRDYDAFVRRVEAVSGVDVYELGEVEGLPVLRVSAGKGDAPVVYINGGTHGDEPAGVEAALTFLEGEWDRWADGVRFEVIPCLCPWSYVHNARLNAQEVDVNWAFLRPNMEVSRRKYGEGIPIALYQRGHTGHLVTSESPTAQPMDVRVAAHLAAVEVMVEANVYPQMDAGMSLRV